MEALAKALREGLSLDSHYVVKEGNRVCVYGTEVTAEQKTPQSFSTTFSIASEKFTVLSGENTVTIITPKGSVLINKPVNIFYDNRQYFDLGKGKVCFIGDIKDEDVEEELLSSTT